MQRNLHVEITEHLKELRMPTVRESYRDEASRLLADWNLNVKEVEVNETPLETFSDAKQKGKDLECCKV